MRAHAYHARQCTSMHVNATFSAKMAPRALKMPSRRSKSSQDALKMLQEAFKRPKMPPRAPRSLQNTPRDLKHHENPLRKLCFLKNSCFECQTPLEVDFGAFRVPFKRLFGHLDRPRWLKDWPKSAHEMPKSAQEASKTAPGASIARFIQGFFCWLIKTNVLMSTSTSM